MNIQPFLKISVAVGFAVLAAFSGHIFLLELRTEPEWAARNINSGQPATRLALSARSDLNIARSCLASMSSIDGRLGSLIAPQDPIQNCNMLITKITQSSSNDSFAWAVLAFASFQLPDTAPFNAALWRSYQTAPNSAWLASIRARLAKDAAPILTEQNQANFDADLALLLAYPNRIAQLGNWYLNSPEFRLKFSAILAQQPRAEMQNFLLYLRRQLKPQTDDS